MRVIIRSALTHHFLSASGQWTEKRSEARGFANAWEALECARHLRLPNIRLIFDFAEPGSDFTLDLGELPPFNDPGHSI